MKQNLSLLKCFSPQTLTLASGLYDSDCKIYTDYVVDW